MTRPSLVVLLLATCLSACAGRLTLTPRTPLTRHAELPPAPPLRDPQVTFVLPEVETFVLPCGMEVNVVTRPSALVGYVGILANGGGFGEVRVEEDIVLRDALATVSESEVRIDESGLYVGQGGPASTTLPRTLALLSALREPTLDVSDVAREVNRLAEFRSHFRTRNAMNAELALRFRLYGETSPHSSAVDHRRSHEGVNLVPLLTRLERLSLPSHLTIVVVGPATSTEVRDALTAATASWPGASHAEPRALIAWTYPEYRPRSHSYPTTNEVSSIFLMERGPGAFADDHGAYRIAVRIFGGLEHSLARSTSLDASCDRCGLHAAIVEEGAGQSLFSLGIAVAQEDLERTLTILPDELERLGHAEVVTREEFTSARNVELTLEAHRFDTSEGIAQALLRARGEGQGIDAYARRFEAIRTATADQTAQAVRTWWRPATAPITVITEGAGPNPHGH